VELEALPARGDVGIDVGARPHGKDRLGQAEKLSQLLHLGVGTKIAGPILLDPADDGKPGIRLLPRYADVGIPFVVLEMDVVGRLLLPDERRLQDERVDLGIDRDEFHVRDAADEGDLFRPDRGRVLEVGADPLIQPLRLSDVEKLSAFIPEQVDAGLGREGRDRALQVDRDRIVGLERGRSVAAPIRGARSHHGIISRAGGVS